MTSIIPIDRARAPQSPDLEGLLADITRQLRDAAVKHDRSGTFAFENMALLHRHGLLSIALPKADGGQGARLPLLAQIIRAIAASDPATALVVTMQYLVHKNLEKSRWPASLRSLVAAEALAEGALINHLRVEPDLGTPARGGLPATIAERTENGWRLSGRKIYSTGSPVLRWYLVWARTDEAEPRVGSFLVHADAPGIRIEQTWDHLGMRASGSDDVIFDNVELPANRDVDVRLPADWGRPDGEATAFMSALLSSLYDSIAHSARDWLVTFLNERKPSGLGAALATLPRFQEAVGEIDALLYANKTLLDDLITRTNIGTAPGANEASLVKYLVTGNAIKAVEKALELTGNPGLSRANPLERAYRDVLCSRIHAPQNDMILINSGRATLSTYSGTAE